MMASKWTPTYLGMPPKERVVWVIRENRTSEIVTYDGYSFMDLSGREIHERIIAWAEIEPPPMERF
jgi:hypothetical protein